MHDVLLMCYQSVRGLRVAGSLLIVRNQLCDFLYHLFSLLETMYMIL